MNKTGRTAPPACRRAARLLSDTLDGALEPGLAGWLAAHVRGCPRCERLRVDLDAIAATARELDGLHRLAPPARAPVPHAMAAPLLARAAALVLLVFAAVCPLPSMPALAGTIASGPGELVLRLRIPVPPLPSTELPTFEALRTPRRGERS